MKALRILRGENSLDKKARTSSCEHGVVGAEAMKGSVLEAERYHAHALAFIIHDEVSSEILDKEHSVESESLQTTHNEFPDSITELGQRRGESSCNKQVRF